MQLGVFLLNLALLALFSSEITTPIKSGQKSCFVSHFKIPELSAESRERHEVHQLSKRQPERLLRHISLLIVRMNRVILSRKEQDALKDETQLALPLVA